LERSGGVLAGALADVCSAAKPVNEMHRQAAANQATGFATS
jgi:hypothetical protein